MTLYVRLDDDEQYTFGEALSLLVGFEWHPLELSVSAFGDYGRLLAERATTEQSPKNKEILLAGLEIAERTQRRTL